MPDTAAAADPWVRVLRRGFVDAARHGYTRLAPGGRVEYWARLEQRYRAFPGLVAPYSSVYLGFTLHRYVYSGPRRKPSATKLEPKPKGGESGGRPGAYFNTGGQEFVGACRIAAFAWGDWFKGIPAGSGEGKRAAVPATWDEFQRDRYRNQSDADTSKYWEADHRDGADELSAMPGEIDIRHWMANRPGRPSGTRKRRRDPSILRGGSAQVWTTTSSRKTHVR
jgi:hypothetical protein